LKKINVDPGATANAATITLATSAGGAGADVIVLTPPANNMTSQVILLWLATGWQIVDLVEGTFS
jgi:hypothetical protein